MADRRERRSRGKRLEGLSGLGIEFAEALQACGGEVGDRGLADVPVIRKMFTDGGNHKLFSL